VTRRFALSALESLHVTAWAVLLRGKDLNFDHEGGNMASIDRPSSSEMRILQ
jgi:hypothetical protein